MFKCSLLMLSEVCCVWALCRHVYNYVGYSQYQPQSAYCCPKTGGRILYWLPKERPEEEALREGGEEVEGTRSRLPLLHDELLLHPAADRLYNQRMKEVARTSDKRDAHGHLLYGPYIKLENEEQAEKDMTVVQTSEGPICIKSAQYHAVAASPVAFSHGVLSLLSVPVCPWQCIALRVVHPR